MTELVEPVRHKLTVHDYHRMGEFGILTPEHRVELIDGDVIDMSPIGSGHVSVVADLTMLIAPRVAGSVIVSVQSPVRLGLHNEPQPDLVVLRPRHDRYRAALPKAEDVILLVEVADTPVAYDRGIKLPLYARHGIQEVWIINLPAKKIEIYRQPHSTGYGEKLEAGPDDTLSPETLPELTLAAEALLD